MSQIEAPPLLACGRLHQDWSEVAQHLVDDFPNLQLVQIVREIGTAKDAVRRAGFDVDDELRTGEAIARHQLTLLDAPEVARLEPEHHRSR